MSLSLANVFLGKNIIKGEIVIDFNKIQNSGLLKTLKLLKPEIGESSCRIYI